MIRGRMLTNHLNGRRLWRFLHTERMAAPLVDSWHGVVLIDHHYSHCAGTRRFDYRTA